MRHAKFPIEARNPMGSCKSHTERADKLRKRAGECRSLAESAQNPLNAASYLKLADLYEALAQEEEKRSLRYPSEG
jgi:hypothetical protein